MHKINQNVLPCSLSFVASARLTRVNIKRRCEGHAVLSSCSLQGGWVRGRALKMRNPRLLKQTTTENLDWARAWIEFERFEVEEGKIKQSAKEVAGSGLLKRRIT